MNSFSSYDTATLRHVSNETTGTSEVSPVISEQDFQEASNEIRKWENYSPTRMVTLNSLAEQLGVRAIYYKDEGSRFGIGSFKAIGAAYATQRLLAKELTRISGAAVSLQDVRNRVFVEEISQITIVSATDGNHGLALAWCAQRFGCKCVIYIHSGVSLRRQASIKRFGATVVRTDGDYDHSVELAMADGSKNGWFVVSDTSWDGYTECPSDVMAGYGVMAEEIVAQLPHRVSHVFLQCGVGGMAASVAAFLRQKYLEKAPKLIIVEPGLADCLYQSALAGHVKPVSITEETLMAGLSCGVPSELAWNILRELVTDFMTIPEQLVSPTMKILAKPFGNDVHIEAGESAVAGLAALIGAARQADFCRKLELDSSSRVLVIGTEGPTDPDIYASLVS